MLGEALMRINCVGRKAYDFRTGRGVVFPSIAYRTHLASANRGLVAGVKQQHHDLAPLIGETPFFAFAVRQRKVWRFGSDLDCACLCQSYFMTSARFAAATCVLISTSLPR